MPEGPDGKTIIIVKKVSGHGGHHGGAWKVAYADFVTAMMALFMVLWLVNSASVSSRERIASYFKRPGVFEKGSGTPLEEGGSGILPDTFAPPSAANSQVIPTKDIYEVKSDGGPKKEGFAGGDDAGEGVASVEQQESFQEVASDLADSMDKSAADIREQLGEVNVKIDQRGLHIEIMDTEKASMFRSGSAAIVPAAQDSLSKIANILLRLPNPVDIEGHTDAKPFTKRRRDRYDNWNLSSDRAHAARRALVAAGMKEWQVARVVGYAAQRPKNPDDKLDPANRRISISMRFTDEAAKALIGTNSFETAPNAVSPVRDKVKSTEEALKQAEQAEQEKEDKSLFAEFDEKDERDTRPEDEEAQQMLKELNSQPSGLRLEIGTSLPEGNIITEDGTVVPAERGQQQSPSSGKKDKIFGDDNPFF